MAEIFIVVVGIAMAVFILLVAYAVCWAAGESARVEEQCWADELEFIDKN